MLGDEHTLASAGPLVFRSVLISAGNGLAWTFTVAMTTLSILWAAYSGGVVFTVLLFILHHSSGHSTCACTTPRAGDFIFIFSLVFSQLPWVVISALDDDVFLLFLPQIMLLDFQQWLMSSSSQTTGEAFPGRSQIFRVSTGWGLWKKTLQEGTTLHTSAAPGGSHFHGSPHLVSMNLLQILAKSFHQHIWCLPQVGNFLGPVSPCRLLPISDVELLGCLMTSVLWWAQ